MVKTTGELEAGFDLDRLIAERVMGLVILEWQMSGAGEAVYEIDHFPGWEPVPRYSTSSALALTVVEALRERGLRCDIHYPKAGGDPAVTIWHPRHNKPRASHGPTALAICRAALKAVSLLTAKREGDGE